MFPGGREAKTPKRQKQKSIAFTSVVDAMLFWAYSWGKDTKNSCFPTDHWCSPTQRSRVSHTALP